MDWRVERVKNGLEGGNGVKQWTGGWKGLSFHTTCTCMYTHTQCDITLQDLQED